MNILLAADGSAFTTKAAEFVATHLDWFKAGPQLHVLHVKAPIPLGHARAVAGTEAVEMYYKEEASAALAPAEQVLNKSGIPFTAGYRVGDIAEEIQAYAKKNNISMIVMGSHGHGALKNLVMGSVATKVLSETTVPVLLVR